MPDERHALAYEASASAMVQQRSRLDGLRTRAATLLTAASIVASFLGAQALKIPAGYTVAGKPKPHSFGVEDAIAVGGFVVLLAAILVIFWPREWRWSIGSTQLYQDYIEADSPASLEEIQRDLALHLEIRHDENDRKLKCLFWWFRGACFALGVEVVAWLVELAKG